MARKPADLRHAMQASAKAADLILIPCRPAIYDLETVATTLELIRLAGEKPVAALLNGVPPRGSKREQAEEVMQGLGLPVCPAAFGWRAAFSDAGAVGLTAQEYDPGSKSATETEGVYRFVSKLIKSKTHKGVKNEGTETRRSTKRHAGEREVRRQAGPDTRGNRHPGRAAKDLS